MHGCMRPAGVAPPFVVRGRRMSSASRATVPGEGRSRATVQRTAMRIELRPEEAYAHTTQMEYGLLLTLDQQHEPVGLFSFQTTVGSIVVAFTDSERMDAAGLAAAKATEKQGTKVGRTSIE